MKPVNLDGLIESALRDEPARQAPAHLHDSVMVRVRCSAMLAQERHSFLKRWVMCAGYGAVLLAAAASIFRIGLASRIVEWMPGLAGNLDYIRATYLNSSALSLLPGPAWSIYTVASGALAIAMAALAAHRLSRT